MRRSIPITTRKKKPGAFPEIRLFTMSDRQAALFDRVCSTMAKSPRVTREQAEGLVEKTVVNLLAGQMPPETAPKVFHEMRLHFPILKANQVRKLLRFGCPQERVEALILRFATDDGRVKQCLVELDPDQADVVNDAIDELVADIETRDEPSPGGPRDAAWVAVCNMVARFLNGAEVVAPADDEGAVPFFVTRASGLFHALTPEERDSLPLADEGDIRRWSFRVDKSR